MKQLRCKILSNYHLRGLYYKISIGSNYLARRAKPGQFVHIRCSDNNAPFLRRPFSIHSVSKGTFEILYEVLGKGTEFLSDKKRGDFLDIIGPLGAGFNYQLPITSCQLPVLVAGGMGVAPLVFLAERLAKSKIKNQKSKILVLIGAKTKNLILCKEEFKKLGCEVKIATEDGSLGFKGMVIDLLKDLLPITNYQLPITIFACGPHAMLKSISKIADRHKINCQISLEEIIACGVGVCLGCAVSTKNGYKLVCKDGPVFNSNEIKWE